MLLPLVVLAAGLIFTFGGTLTRLTDRMGISYAGGIILQFLIALAVILPHVKTDTHTIAYVSILLLILIYAAYRIKVRTKLGVKFWMGVIAYSGGMLGLEILFGSLGIPEWAVQLLLGVFAGGGMFLCFDTQSGAFCGCCLMTVSVYFIMLFTPLYMFTPSAVLFGARQINLFVYALYLGLWLMHRWKPNRNWINRKGKNSAEQIH